MKKLGLWLMAACLIVGSSFGAVACGGKTPSTNSSVVVQDYIELSDKTVSLEVFTQHTLTVSSTNVDGEVVWTTSNAAVATVEGGVVKALSEGSATITATVGKASATCVVTVTSLSGFPELAVSNTSLEFIVGGAAVLVDAVATYKGDAVDCEFTWETANPSVATVENGLITPVGIGATTITVTTVCLGEILTQDITVIVNVDEQVQISKGQLILALAEINPGEITTDTFTAQAYVEGELNENATLVFETSDASVATVSVNGNEATVTAVGEGDCMISVYYDSENGRIESTVEVSVRRSQVTFDDIIEVEYAGAETTMDFADMNLVGELEGVYAGGEIISTDGVLDEVFVEINKGGLANVEVRTDVAVYFMKIRISVHYLDTSIILGETSSDLSAYEGDVTAVGFEEGDSVYTHTVTESDAAWVNRLTTKDSAKITSFAHWIVEFSLSDEPTGSANSSYIMTVFVGSSEHMILVNASAMELNMFKPGSYTGSSSEHNAEPCVSIYDANGKIPAKLYANQKYYFEMHLAHAEKGDLFAFAFNDALDVYVGASYMCTDAYYQENIAPNRDNSQPEIDVPVVPEDPNLPPVSQGDNRTEMPTYSGNVTELGFPEDTETVYVLETTEELAWNNRIVIKADISKDVLKFSFISSADLDAFTLWPSVATTTMGSYRVTPTGASTENADVTRKIKVLDIDGNKVSEFEAGELYVVYVYLLTATNIQFSAFSEATLYIGNIEFINEDEIPTEPLVAQGENRKPMPIYGGDVTALGFAEGTVVYEIVGPQSNASDVKLVAKVDSTGDMAYAKMDIVFSKATTSFGLWITAANSHLGYYTITPTSFSTDSIADPTRTIFVTDANGEKVNSFAANTIYTLYIGLDGREVTVQTTTWADLTMYVANIACITEAEAPVDPKPPVEGKEISILFIGNSFSDDTEAYMVDILLSLGYSNINIGNLYIGGCSIDTHYSNITKNASAYDFRMRSHNGKKYTEYETVTVGDEKRSIAFAIAYKDWDVISVQQASGESGKADSYKNLNALVAEVQKQATNADVEIVFNMTWAYQGDSTHAQFPDYNSNQMTMYNAIINAVQSEVEYTVVPNGTAIQNARTSLLGDTLTRDGYHLDLKIGRYIAGLTFVAKVTGIDVADIEYVPGGVNEIQFAIAIESVQNALENPFEITQSELEEEDFKDPDVFAGGSNKTAVSVYKGDETALGFDEDTRVYEYVGLDMSTDKAAIKVDSVNYDYVEVQFVIAQGDGYFFMHGLKGGNWHNGGASYVVDPGWIRIADGNNTASDRVIEIYDANGNKVTSLMKNNVVYTLKVYIKVGELDEIRISKSGSTIYFANVTQGCDSDDSEDTLDNAVLDDNGSPLNTYEGDVTALGFAEGSTVYEYTGTDKAAIKVDSANYDYVEVQFVIAQGDGYFFLFGLKGGNWHNGGVSYVVDPSNLRFSDNTASDRIIEVYDANGNKVTTLMSNNVVYTLRVYIKVGNLDEIRISKNGSTIYFANVTQGTASELPIEGPIKQGETNVSLPNYSGDVTELGFEEGEYLQYMETETVANVWGDKGATSGKTREQLAAKIFGEAGKYVTIKFATTEDIASGSVFYVWGLLSGSHTINGFLSFTNTTYGRILDVNGNAVSSITKNTVYILELYMEGTDTYKVANLCPTGMKICFAADTITCSDTPMEAEKPDADSLITAGGSNVNAVSKYDGDVTALGFAEGTDVYKYVGVDSVVDKAAIKVDSANYDYVEVQFVIAQGDGYFFMHGLKGGNWHNGGVSYVVDPGWIRLGDGNNTASDRVIEIYDADGNKVTSLMKNNVVYTLRVYIKVGNLDEIRISKNNATIYFGEVSFGNDE